MPIILFDVDMTLLYSGGAGSLAMRRAFHQLYGIDDAFGRIEFSGRTDVAIVRDAMREHGIQDGAPSAGSGQRPSAGSGQAFDRELARFRETYYELLGPTLLEAEGGRVMPGVPALLEALAARPEARIGLATGNFRKAAFMKLRHFRLDAHLRDGGFADDAEDRADLVRIAIERVAGDGRVDPASVWVVGDTALDIAAAHANRARALAVATGARTADELRAAGADLALDDLSDTETVLGVLVG